MPAQKRKRMLRKQARKRKRRRKNFLKLTKNDLKLIARERNFADGRQAAVIVPRNMQKVNKEHNADFLEVIRKLSEKFKSNAITVLDEGTGISSFPDELKQKAGAVGINLNVLRTDFAGKNFPRASLNANPKTQKIIAGAINAVPQELIKKIGRNKVHLLVSTFGGIDYTGLPLAKSLSNVLGVLKPGGMASIRFLSDPNMTNHGFELIQKWESAHPNAQVHILKSKNGIPSIIRMFKK